MNVPTSTVQTTWQDVVNAITAEAKAAGLTTDQTNAALTVAATENGYSGNPGDNGTSFGVFQFHYGGQLNSFAAWLGLPILLNGQINPAVISAANNLDTATQFALQQGGYLHNAIVNGSKAGNSGLNLALYAEQIGQGAQWTSQAIANVTAQWVRLFGNTQPGDTVTGAPPPAPAPTPTPAPTLSTVPVLGPLIDSINGVGTSISGLGVAAAQIVLSIERFFWIGVGLALIALGVWILVQSEPHEQTQTKVVPIPV